MTTSTLTESQKMVWESYQRLRLRLSERLNRELAEATGLSEADFEVLTALIESSDDSVRALSLRCGLEWEKSRLSHHLRRMEKRGLIIREDCIEDNRGTVIRVTALGSQLAVEARLIYEQAVQRYVTDVLTADQLEALGEITSTILKGLEVGERRREHH